MSTEPAPPADARLIRQRREAAEPPMSRRQAASRAGISPSQWSDIERGSKKAGHGTVVPIRATAETLAQMARAVGATADELTAAGRTDAAGLLHAAEQDQGRRQRLAAIPGIGVIGARELAEAGDQEELLPLIAAGLDLIDSSDLPGPVRRELAAHFTSGLIRDATSRHRELVLMLKLASAARQPC